LRDFSSNREIPSWQKSNNEQTNNPGKKKQTPMVKIGRKSIYKLLASLLLLFAIYNITILHRMDNGRAQIRIEQSINVVTTKEVHEEITTSKVNNKVEVEEEVNNTWVDQVLQEPLKDKLDRIKTEDNEVIITIATYGFKEFLLNWLCSIKRFGMEKHLLIYTVDKKLAQELIEKHKITNVYLEDKNWSYNNSVQYEQKPYRELMMHRTEFIRNVFVNLNYRVLLADNDAVWIKNPLPYIKKNHRYKDMVAQNDSMLSKQNKRPLVCAGFLYLNTTKTMKRVWSDITNIYSRNVKKDRNIYMTEQLWLDQMKRRTDYDLLPWNLFPSGYLFFDQKDSDNETDEQAAERRKIEFKDVYVVHNNWIVGKEKKMRRFQERPGQLWLLDENEKCRYQ
jgi:rRNA-processing protein FCF1